MKSLEGLQEVLDDIAVERVNAERKWGPQSHPSFFLNKDRTGERPSLVECELAHAYGVPTATHAKQICEFHRSIGKINWFAILQEEVSECIGEWNDDKALETELLQVGAVVCAWVADIRKKRGS